MREIASPGWRRREFVGGAALLALVVGVPASLASVSAAETGEAPSARQRALIGAVAATMLPATDTPGADAAAVGDFVVLALAHGLDGTRAPAASAAMPLTFSGQRRRDGSLRYLEWLEVELDRAAGGDWLRNDAAGRERTLTDFDAAAFSAKDESPWRKLKGLILLGYYTSEIGASRELQFELTPGRYDPKVPLGPHARAFSSDWTAVDFG